MMESAVNSTNSSDYMSSDMSPDTGINIFAPPPYCKGADFYFPVFIFDEDTLYSTFVTKPFETFITTVFMPIAGIIGIVGNLTFMFVIARVNEMRTITNFYLLNLAVSDLIYIIVKAGRHVLSYHLHNGLRRAELSRTTGHCYISRAFEYVTYFASLLLVTLVSFERFLAICYPLKHRMVNTKKRTVTLVVATWLLAVVCAGCMVPANGRLERYCFWWPARKPYQDFPNVRNTCLPIRLGFNYAYIVYTATSVPYIILLLVNVTFYGKIIISLSNRAVTKHDDTSGNSNTNTVRNQVARMLIINGIFFFLLLSPYAFIQLYRVITYFCDDNNCNFLDYDERITLTWTGYALWICNSSINPYVYSFTNSRYRRALMKAFCRQE